MENTFEFFDPGPSRDVPFGSKAGTDDEILGLGSPTIGSLDMPTSFVSFELSINNNTLKSRLALDVENPVASIEIISQVVIIWVVIWPIVSGTCQLIAYSMSRYGTNALMTSGILNWYSGTSESTIAPASVC